MNLLIKQAVAYELLSDNDITPIKKYLYVLIIEIYKQNYINRILANAIKSSKCRIDQNM